MSKCTVEGCKRRYKARGYCGAHYSRWNRTGIAPIGAIRTPPGYVPFKSDNLRLAELPEGLETALGAIFRRLP